MVLAAQVPAVCGDRVLNQGTRVSLPDAALLMKCWLTNQIQAKMKAMLLLYISAPRGGRARVPARGAVLVETRSLIEPIYLPWHMAK